MAKLTILRGLPGSGKSSYARERLASDGNTIRVNRDDLRAMLHDGKWSGAKERITEKVERAIVAEALAAGKNVIVDDTNLGFGAMESWTYFVQNCRIPNVEIRIHDFRENVTLSECIRRDRLREGKARVGRGVIEKMALRNGLIDLSKFDKIAIVDIDGTLANLDHRLPFIQDLPKNYDEFFRLVTQDGVFHTIWDAVHKLSETGHTIIVLSGRPASTGFDTDEWLGAQEYMTEGQTPIPLTHLFMRDSGDHRSDDVVKRRIFEMMGKAGLKKDAVKVVLDDRDSVCAVWRDLGLPLIQVDRGNVIDVAPAAVPVMLDLGLPLRGNGADLEVTNRFLKASAEWQGITVDQGIKECHE